jgi:hypothetical protein
MRLSGTVSAMLIDGMVVDNELVATWEYVVCLDLGYCSDICMEEIRKILKNLKLG